MVYYKERAAIIQKLGKHKSICKLSLQTGSSRCTADGEKSGSEKTSLSQVLNLTKSALYLNLQEVNSMYVYNGIDCQTSQCHNCI